MTTRCVHVLTLAAVLCAGQAFAQASTMSAVPSNAEITRILTERVDTYHQSPGVVVGVIEPTGRRIVTYGRAAADSTRPLDGDTLFEIGSMSKVFTSLLLADAAAKGEVALTDPVSKYLPPGTKVPERGRAITLQDLSMHVSGLPRLPTNINPKDVANPYADYTVEQMYQFLAGYQLPRDVGATYEYSNLGAGLLGHLLARRAGMDYEALVKSRITGPLGMRSTVVTLTPPLQSRLAIGHDRAMQPVSNWDLPTLTGAGGLRSSANDILTFLGAVLGYSRTPLAPAMAAMLKPRQSSTLPVTEIALAWHISNSNGKSIVWHNGGTGGYRTFMGYLPEARTGVVVLTNGASLAGPDDIGRHLLDPKSPLLDASSPALAQPKTRTEISLSHAVFDRYVGRYLFALSAFITVSRDGNRFLAQLTGQPAFEIFAESEREFFYKVVDAQLTFEVDADGRATAVALHQLGRDQRAVRANQAVPTPEQPSSR